VSRVTGQDVSITIIRDGKVVEPLSPFTAVSIDFEREVDREDYFGEAGAAFADFGAVTFTMQTDPKSTGLFRSFIDDICRPQIERQRQDVLAHMQRGGLFLHPNGFLARVYLTRTLTGAWLVRTRAASLHGEWPWESTRRRYRTRALAMREVVRLLTMLMVVPGEDRPIDAVPLFAARDGSKIPTQFGAVEFARVRRCQSCRRSPADSCAYLCGAVLCKDCGAEHQPPDCPPQMDEYLRDTARSGGEP